MNVTDAAEGRKLRFDFGADNGDGTGRVAQFLWNGDDANHISRGKWGLATLAN